MFRLEGIKHFYRKIQRKIRNFLLSDQSREFLIFLFFFIVSMGFWLLQTLKNDYETEFTVPIRLKNVPNDVIMTLELPSEIQIRVLDKGTVLLNYMLGQNLYPIVLDFNMYKNRGNHVKILTKELEKRIAGQLSASSKLLLVRPDTLEYVYTQGQAKKVPVRLNGSVVPGPLYYITDTIYSPDSVIVYAPNSILDTLKYIETELVNFTNLEDTTRKRLSLHKIKGVKYVPSSIEIILPTDIITEKILEVPLVGIGFPPDKVLRTFPSKVKLTFQVGLNRFKAIHPYDFILEIPYDELIHNTSDKYKVKITSQPTGISHIRITPQEVDYLIEQTSNYVD